MEQLYPLLTVQLQVAQQSLQTFLSDVQGFHSVLHRDGPLMGVTHPSRGPIITSPWPLLLFLFAIPSPGKWNTQLWWFFLLPLRWLKSWYILVLSRDFGLFQLLKGGVLTSLLCLFWCCSRGLITGVHQFHHLGVVNLLQSPG